MSSQFYLSLIKIDWHDAKIYIYIYKYSNKTNNDTFDHLDSDSIKSSTDYNMFD